MVYADLQINGYGGVDFNGDNLDLQSLSMACARIRQDGTVRFLATVISDDLAKMIQRVARIATLASKDRTIGESIGGLHIEGPFLNPSDGYRGAHPLDAMRLGDVDAMNRLIDAGQGLVRLVTLAPERDPGLRVTRMLVARGIVVSAGHTDATVEQLRGACDAGLTLFTHLGNACPALIARHDNIIQRALSVSDRLRICFIADGVHIPFFALNNYLRCVGVDRAIVVSDAMSAAGLGPGAHRLGRWTVHVGDDGAAWSQDRSHLVGSAMSLRQAHDNLRNQLGLDEPTCRRLLHDNAMKVMNTHAAG